MEEFLLSSISSFIMEEAKGAFSGIRGTIRFCRIKKQLRTELLERIQKTYGNYEFYNKLDQFLTKNDVICNVIRNCTSTSLIGYNSQSQMIAYYAQQFVEEHPDYTRYLSDVRTIIRNCFIIVFNSLNKIPDENTRVICTRINELIGEQNVELGEIRNKVNHIETMVSHIMSANDDSPHFDQNRYFNYIAALYPSYSFENYLPRTIHPKRENSQNSGLIETLLVKKRLIIVGEAGFGKTYESISLIKKLRDDERTAELIPVFFPLREYGTLYDSIRAGIAYKIGPFCDGNIDIVIDALLSSQRVALIFDGIDEIVTDEHRTKFFIDANDYLAKYPDILCYFSSRFNQYRGQLAGIEEYSLTPIDESTVRHELWLSGITVDIPHEYILLFSNPYFLFIGKKALKGNRNHHIFNRSQLFGELFYQLYDGLDHQKGLPHPRNISYSEALTILSNFAYDTFYQPSYSVLEFDRYISKVAANDCFSTIASFISSGLFVVTDRVLFAHKLLKEFCTAYYLVSNCPVQENYELYRSLICKEEWKEVFIFVSGLFDDVDKQEEFLNFVMQNNLALYIECVYAKNDVIQPDLGTIEDRTHNLLSQILYSYNYIVQNYFAPIANLFEPDGLSKHSEKKIGITGCLSGDEKFLDYWFDVIPNSNSDIECFNNTDLIEIRDQRCQRAMQERRGFVSHGISLDLRGLSTNNGRYIAIEAIKKRLSEIIKQKLLIESDSLLCERLSLQQKKVSSIQNVQSLTEMSAILNEIIESVLKQCPKAVRFEHNGIDLFYTRAIVSYLCKRNVDFQANLLPGPDIPYENAKTGLVWDLYSNAQKEKRIQKYFYLHQLSYLDMVKKNFPNLYSGFSRVMDSPYQSLIFITYDNSGTQQDDSSDPSLLYYYIASSEDSVPLPRIINSTDPDYYLISEDAIKIIQKSFQDIDKTAHGIVFTRTNFSYTLSSLGTGKNNPLSEFVYKTIQKSLEEVFGRF